MREQIMQNDMGLNWEGLRVTNTAEERESHETKGDKNKRGWMIHSLLGFCFVCGRTHSNNQTFKLCPLKFVVPFLIWLILYHSLKTISNEPKCAVLFWTHSWFSFHVWKDGKLILLLVWFKIFLPHCGAWMWCWKIVCSGYKHQSEIQRASSFKYLTTNNLVHKTDWVFMDDSIDTLCYWSNRCS